MRQFMLLKKWLPGAEMTEEHISMAVAMEQDYWESMEITMQNAIAKALGAK